MANESLEVVQVVCYSCNEAGYHPYASENGYTLVKCNGCGLLYVNPRPTDAAISQAHQYGEHTDKKLYLSGAYDKSIISRYHQVLRDLYGDTLKESPRSWVDVGCGWGEFIEALNSYSGGQVNTIGIEPNQMKRTSAQQRGLNVDYFDLDTHDKQYDVLSLLNVYSHLTDPKMILGQWRRLLRPGGEFLIETGDTATLSSKDHYRPLFLPDHLSFASEEIVCGILEEIGFEIVAVRKYQTFRPTPMRILKEVVKWALPNRQSTLRYLFKNYPTDMFVRAKLKGS